MNISISPLLLSALMATTAQLASAQDQPDSLYLRAYTTADDNYHTGLHFDWSTDSVSWTNIGSGHSFVKSDYGNWGAQKRMLNPQLTRHADGTWTLLFNVGEDDLHQAITTSPDLIHWKPQDYFLSSGQLSPEGTVIRVEAEVVRRLEAEAARAQAAATRNAERATDDHQRFFALDSLRTHITVSGTDCHDISGKLMGIFFEDISYAADGGLYAEMVENRDFEYSARDHREGKWNAATAWSQYMLQDKKLVSQPLSITTSRPLHTNNAHHAVISVDGRPITLTNDGWDGMALTAKARYDMSLWVRLEKRHDSKSLHDKPITVTLRDMQGRILAQGRLAGADEGRWQQLKCTLTPKEDCPHAYLELLFTGRGADYHVDMVSLFPHDTYHQRANGMRRDLAEALEALHPCFIRFPGGCVAHGNGIDNMYRWKNTIGPLEARQPNWNIWHYHQTVGLGFYEYFQLCEDLGAEPLPVLAAGVPCQNSSVGQKGNEYGQQGGIPLGPQMDAYIQDVLDLIEWANGDAATSPWAQKRAEAGHPAPFGLKMIGIGNEDLISQVFEERFRLIYDAVHTRYPDIEIVGTVGPFYEGSDYDEGWRLARELGVATVDEHYYNSPGWFVNNQHFYDDYQRGGTRVYLGEYAAHIPSRQNNIETALAEALYLCNVERNGDVVEMTSYAPLFARKGHTSWNPDLIYFDSQSVSPTTGYEVQRLFGCNSGTVYYPAASVTTYAQADGISDADVQKRIASSCVRDTVTGEYIVKVVNYLPVGNDFTLSLPFLDAPSLVAATELSDALDACEAKAHAKTDVTLDRQTLTTRLAPYSLTVIRIK